MQHNRSVATHDTLKAARNYGLGDMSLGTSRGHTMARERRDTITRRYICLEKARSLVENFPLNFQSLFRITEAIALFLHNLLL